MTLNSLYKSFFKAKSLIYTIKPMDLSDSTIPTRLRESLISENSSNFNSTPLFSVYPVIAEDQSTIEMTVSQTNKSTTIDLIIPFNEGTKVELADEKDKENVTKTEMPNDKNFLLPDKSIAEIRRDQDQHSEYHNFEDNSNSESHSDILETNICQSLNSISVVKQSSKSSVSHAHSKTVIEPISVTYVTPLRDNAIIVHWRLNVSSIANIGGYNVRCNLSTF